jgi:hypothetical protein
MAGTQLPCRELTTRQPILVTVKAGNQMDVIDLENETTDAETLN